MNGVISGMNKRLAAEVLYSSQGRILGGVRRLFSFVWGVCFHAVRPLVFLLMLSGVLLFIKTKHRALMLICFITVAYNALVSSVFGDIQPRYIYHTFLVELIVASAVIVRLQFKKTIEK